MAMPLDEKKPLLNNRPSFRGEGGVTSGYYRTDRSDPPRQLSCAAEATVSSDNGTMDREEMGGGRDVNSNSPARQFGTESRLAKVVLIAVTISYFLGYIPSMVIMNPFIYDRIAEEYNHEVNTSSQMPCVKHMNDSTGNTSGIEIQIEIERRVSTLELYLHLTTYVTAIIPILLLGPISDTYGRKIGFILPILGTLIKQIVYIIVVALRLPVSLLYLAHAIEACGGSFAAMLSAIFSVTSDVTQVGQGRSGWIAVMEALQTLAAASGQIYTAQWMRHGYLHPLICALCMCCVALVMTIFLLPETHSTASTGDSSHASNQEDDTGQCWRILRTCWNTVKESVAVYYKDGDANQGRDGQQRILCKRRLCLAIFILTVAVNFSRTGVEALFQLKYPLCWAATQVYTFSGVRIFLSWLAILVTLGLMQKLFKMADRHVAIVGIVSSILSNAALSLAVNDAMVYEAAVVGYMTRSIIPMLRSVLSSVVDHAHQGAMYAGLSCIESLGASVFSTAANRIYYASLSYWAGEIFVVFACIMIIALVLQIISNVLFANDQNRVCVEARQADGNIQHNS
ncbi:hypothetical protein RRG08_035233 [Elysia crispata]|uniref:Solute carrier family 46 member 3 n=1 Tax=Elysia crispata TaxID=231223 RepID=A0AAE0ZMJ3_9GAST|nr:hypothetical protein RRG08_035233 [Elysia crispata]